MWRGWGSSVESLLELRDGPRLDEAQADFRLLASSHTRLEKSIILASAVSCQNHPQRIVDVGGVAARAAQILVSRRSVPNARSMTALGRRFTTLRYLKPSTPASLKERAAPLS